MADLSGSVCLNHPDTPAVTRCASCSKPICKQCIVSRNGSNYCSETCAKNAAETVGQVNRTLEERRRTGAKTRLRAIILLVIIIIIAAAASWYYNQNKSDVDRLMRETGAQIEKNVQETKATIQQGVPTSSQYKRDREAMVE